MDGFGHRPLTLDTLSKAYAKILGRPTATELDRLELEFLNQALEDYVADEIPDLNAEDFANILAEFWRFGEVKALDSGPLIRIRRAESQGERVLPYDLIEIIQADAPFLVDSVMGELGEQGVSVRAMFHPVLKLERYGQGLRRPQGDTHKESMILVVVDTISEDRRKALQEGLLASLEDVHAAVTDFDAMKAQMVEQIALMEKGVASVDPEVLAENIALLRWLKGDHFVFLGSRIYEYPRTQDGGYASQEPLSLAQAGLGVLRDANRPVLRRASEPAVLTAQIRQQLDLSEPVTVAKANIRSRVHRRAYMDYVGIKRYGPDGKPSGELRFVGLFTAEAYDRAARDVPLVRRKVDNIMRLAAKLPDSHNEKRLRNIVENYPRDELFQTSEQDLYRIAMGMLHLFDRPRVRLFTRKDPFDRFVSVLMFVPRERYDPIVRQRAAQVLAEAWGGRISAWYPQLSDAPLVRIHYIVGVTPGDHLEPDESEIEAKVAEIARSWSEKFEAAARDTGLGEQIAQAKTSRWAEGFPQAYRDMYCEQEALLDVSEIKKADPEAGISVRAFRHDDDSNLRFRFKLYRCAENAVPLADVLPVLENMGLKALEEYGFPITPQDGSPKWWIHEFLIEDPRGADLVFSDVKDAFEDAFEAIWTKKTESDGFNRLVIELGLNWREATILRALCRYRQQSGLDPSQATQEEALRDNPIVTLKLIKLFRARFDPHFDGSEEDRLIAVDDLYHDAIKALQNVSSLDHDRVLRRLALLIQAIKRTNVYQPNLDGQPKPYMSFKIASQELADLPAPKPFREIFVWAPHIEGVHLRFGPVARGGLRWSDRRDDFRTEVLGLVKAQQVKNAVIVPVGSKGGFYPKALPRGGTPDAVRAEGIRAYKTFLSGLLDITDNINAANEVVRPKDVYCWEGDDPYLVVAADKGTATFSDIANGVSQDYGFWLGDAFASGGSAGYDHKVMGITARGAWEAVKRHFREMGKDIQSEPFTVAGVGDMSGDVFGNGMLLSKSTKLVAAFDHRDIFLDPNPDPLLSWAERDRMFKLSRSSWADYDRSKISKGGGIFSRSLKSIPVSAEVREILNISAEELSPPELMKAILKAPVELLYFGGIGTYIKAPNETHLDVGDKVNDPIRVNSDELNCKVIGEGANLGLTQAGRIAFARLGGRLNTDAIDNSAGVDSSDHEVNIKILTGAVERAGKLDREARNTLLASMTDEVAHKVLAHNYDQTLALSLQEATAVADLDAHGRFMSRLERIGRLDRKVEGLPAPQVLKDLQGQGKALSRPELAVLTAYAKLELFDEIVASQAPDDPIFEDVLVGYFPAPLAQFEAEMRDHRLKREIISTILANQIINVTGATFPERLKASAECDTKSFVFAYVAATKIFRLDEAWDKVSALDLKISAKAQNALYLEIIRVLRRQTLWLARRSGRTSGGVLGLIEAYRPAADALRIEGISQLSEFEQDRVSKRVEEFVSLGVPHDLATDIAMLLPLTATSDVADLAGDAGWAPSAVARLYHQAGASFGFDRLRAGAGTLAGTDHWERLAVRRLIEDLLDEQAYVVRAVLTASKSGAGVSVETAARAVSTWISGRKELVDQVRRTVEEIEQSGPNWTFAKLTIASASLRELTSAAAKRK